MAASSAPIEVGTRGTIASLLKKEIEHFRRLQVECIGSSSAQSHRHVQEMASNGGKSWANFSFFPWRRKKRRGTSSNGSVVRPGICSMMDVANCSHRLSEMSHFGYRNLRSDHIQEI